MDNEKIQVAILTGGHPYDVISFNRLLGSLPGVGYYIQAIEEFCTDPGKCADKYDVIMFYNMTNSTPQDTEAWDTVYKRPLEEIAERGQGIFVLHHATLAFPEWDFWDRVTGLQRKTFTYEFDQKVRLHVEDPKHPITQDLKDWEMIDETYFLTGAREGSHILITTDNETSMDTIAWTRQCGNSRVFCFQSGHDKQAYGNESFREVIIRGLKWVSCRI